MNWMDDTALELGKKIRAGELSAVEATEAALKAIREKDAKLHCFVTVDEERALSKAETVQAQIMAGTLTGPLAGVPVAVKDNLCTEGLLTTCASKILYNYIPAYTAEAVKRLENAGAIVAGKTNMDEFAFGNTTETSAFGVTKNPVDLSRVPGGSSGGSCAAVAAAEVPCALGTDTGGSVRQPSALCGVVGLKPTYGTVSRYGLIAYASSMDVVGPVAGNVADCAALLELLVGYDPKDSTSVAHADRGRHDSGCDFMSALVPDVRGLRIGIPGDYLKDGLDSEVKAAVLRAARTFEELGAHVEEFTLGLVDYAVPAYYVIACAEASSNLARYDGVKYGYRAAGYDNLHGMYKKTRAEGFGMEAKRRIMLGSFVLSEGYYDKYYLKALKVRSLIKQAFDDAFEKYDLILGPTAPSTAPLFGENLTDRVRMYLGDIYTVSANLAGLPAISVPCGRDHRGLPIGLQLAGNCFAEKTVIRAAYSFESCHTGGAV